MAIATTSRGGLAAGRWAGRRTAKANVRMHSAIRRVGMATPLGFGALTTLEFWRSGRAGTKEPLDGT
jgi:hypothetical protein